jgi:hypothetical protein
MPSPIINHFSFYPVPDNVKAEVQTIREQCAGLAMQMEHDLPDCAEKSAGLRKLLEAKDCFVRARIEQYAKLGS